MPIRPENRERYPGGSPNSKEWKEIRAAIRERAGNKCEWCGVINKAWRDNGKKLIRVVCTVAHLDHDPGNNEPENLAFLCQRCHNRYDAKHRAENRQKNKTKESKADE